MLFSLESLVCGLANTSRILVTAEVQNPRVAPGRLSIAGRYLVLHTGLVLSLAALVWYVFAPTLEVQVLLTDGSLSGLWRFAVDRQLVIPLALAAGLLFSEVIARSDYIDAYLRFGPATVARYGYSRPAGLALFVVFSALSAAPSRSGVWLSPLYAPYGATFLIASRLLLDLANLWTPVWGRWIFGRLTSLTRWAEQEKARRRRNDSG